MFTGIYNYFLIKLECFDHETINNIDNIDNYDNTCFYVELIKDIENLIN